MVPILYRFLAVTCAWYVGLRFIRTKAGIAAGIGAVVGLAYAGISYGLSLLDAELWLIPACVLLFALTALLAMSALHCGWGSAVHSLLLAFSAWAVLSIPLKNWPALGLPALFVGGALLLLFPSMTEWLYPGFPEL